MNRLFTAPIIIVVSILLFAGVLLTQPSVSRNKKAVKENDKVETPFLSGGSSPADSGLADFSGSDAAEKKV
ncbi:MAG TPA: hypothetical protein P5080_05360 [Candidatus Paceibacterota bacterium]|nr:hypothetical protein [Candidatus Pacearchaeota archaeon]HRZ51375.1 hypothetical protein [Candidatus Paceibacterota bacterium]HSA37097.1 hypothetical protein [Candidatus Paceibacterota bacterium]